MSSNYNCKQETNASSSGSCCQACNQSHKHHTCQDHLYHRTRIYEYTLGNIEHKHNMCTFITCMTTILFQPKVQDVMQNMSTCFVNFNAHKKFCGYNSKKF